MMSIRQAEFLGDYIDGQFVLDAKGDAFSSIDPSNVSHKVCTAYMRESSVDEAVQAAHKALKSWRKGGIQSRVDALMKVAELVERHQESIAQAISSEMGKSIAEALVEAGSIAGKIKTTISQLSYTLPQASANAPGEQRFHPLGVVAVIGPFNFPIHLLNTHIIPALITGNTVVIKPSEITPLCGQRYAELFHAAGFPAGVLNVVHGTGSVGAQLVAHEDIQGIIFTGSYETGRKIRQATFDQPYKKVCLELGGKNPAIVLDDADLAQATREILLGAFLTSGQRCTATSRVIATAKIADQLKQELVNACKKLHPSHPMDQNTLMGPLANQTSQHRFMNLLEQAKSEGAEPWVESKALAGTAYVTPSIYGVTGEEAYLTEELFGPHISFQTVANEEEAIHWAQKNQYGLSASLFTASKESFENFYDEISAGVLNWNRSTNGASGLLPFGGVGKSGNWHAAGSEGPRLSTYPVAVMSIPFGDITKHAALEQALMQDPIQQLERQHRLEEVAERFGVWLSVKGLSLLLPFEQLTIREGGYLLSDDALRAQALLHQLESDEEGILFHLDGRVTIDVLEERFLRFLETLLYLDPASFFVKYRREINTPTDDRMPRSSQWLSRFYGGGFFPKEKKPAVVDLARSQGPFLRSVDDDALQIIDAASQIASLPAGFRPDRVQRALDEGGFDPYLMSSSHPDELQSEIFEQLATAMQKHAPKTTPHVCWTNGGAEANEKAFALAHRHGPGGKRVIAFESAFHGRTLISLYCTWNPVKREPYQLKGYEAVFLTRPIPNDPYVDPEIPSDWYAIWSTAQHDLTLRDTLKGDGQDELLNAEVDALVALEKELQAGDLLACIIEPYQCEGGDVTPTRRFFHGLRALTRAYKLPLIFDEVQSGFGLSGAIFWHQNLKLVNQYGQEEGPDLVTGAKRAQVGYVLSHWPDPEPSPAHAASAVRGLAHLQLISEIESHETLLRECLEDLCKRWHKIVTRPRAFGDAFAFDLPSNEIANHLIGQRFYQGYMVYIAGKRTLRYRMNRSFKAKEIKEVFRVIENSLIALTEQAGGPGDDLIERMSQCKAAKWIKPKKVDANYQLTLTEVLTVPGDADIYLKHHGELNAARRAAGEAVLSLSADVHVDDMKVLIEADHSSFELHTGYPLIHFVADRIGTRVRQVDLAEFDRITPAIQALEEDSYEPARQDDIATLRSVASHAEGVVFVAEDIEGLVGMSFASPLEAWTHVESTNEDYHQGANNTLYGADTTVHYRVRGHGVGYRLREAVIRYALQAKTADGRPRYAFITGRNRVGEADAMWSLNQKWGAYLVKCYDKQYGENAQARYYRIPLRRYDRRAFDTLSQLKPSTENLQLWGVHQVTNAYHPLLDHAAQIGVFDEPALTKLTVSNFITPAYARYAEALRAIAPPGCAHMYFTSCLDEMVDKTIRSLKHNRSQGEVVLSLSGDHFGANTAAARSLRDDGDQVYHQYFDWPSVPHPSDGVDTTMTALDSWVEAHGAEHCIALFVESIQTNTGKVLSQEAWQALCAWRDRTGIPLVLSEVNSGFKRSTHGFWWLDGVEGESDVVLWWSGGQIGHIFVRPHVFVAKPLTLISTWDGDELSATRLLWQMYATRGINISEQSAALDKALTSVFSTDQIQGLGLYRVVEHTDSERILEQLKAQGIQVQRREQRLIFAPPLTLDQSQWSYFEQALKHAV